MPIAFSKYVNIVSAVGGAGVATARELILRLISTDFQIPSGSVVEFDTAAEVSAYFGATSAEFLQAQFYFAFISKLATQPSKISFTHWADAATAPRVIGEAGTYAVGDYDSIADGTLTVTMGPDTEVLSGLDFTLDASLADVAATIETAVQAAPPATLLWTAATVTYNTTAARFELLGGDTGAAAMDVAATVAGTDMRPLLGWAPPGVRLSFGSDIQTITEVLTESTELSNNYGSFSFIDILLAAESLEAATWNDGENVKFMFTEKVGDADAATLQASLANLGGVGLTLYDGALSPAEYPWLLPSSIMAATPYFRRASVQNYMFQQASLTPSVTGDTLSATYDAIAVNYYGQTQQAGQNIAFYQRGFLQGLSSDPVDMGIYANEVFLKDAIGVSIINLLLALSSVPANASGSNQVLSVIQSDIDDALTSGIISVGKELDSTQIAFITSVTGDNKAYLQIQGIGYWISAQILEPTPDEFVVDYTLLYSKNDSIRKVEGSHILI